jgi:hypothetical protein
MSRAALCTLALLLTELVTVSTPALLFAQTFQPQTRLGVSSQGDTWEPSIAADRYGHVYALIPDFPPNCKGCPSSIAYLVVSNNNGKTWSVPRQIADPDKSTSRSKLIPLTARPCSRLGFRTARA